MGIRSGDGAARRRARHGLFRLRAFARRAALLELATISKADLEILFIRLCAQQRWASDQPAQKLMRASTFAFALRELADRAFPEQTDDAARFEQLLSHIEHGAVVSADDD